jgi:hypothetical protein
VESATTEETARLIRYYKKAGYKYIKGSEYMYKTQTDELFQMLGI